MASTSNSSQRRKGRRAPRSQEQLREDMVSAGIALLSEHGLSVGVEAVSFDEAIIAADVPRASAYRAWSDSEAESGPQTRFHQEVASKLLTEQPGISDGQPGALDATLEVVGPVIDRLPPNLNELGALERGALLREIHRRGSNANQHSMDRSRLWHCYLAVAAGLMSQADPDADLREAWRVGEENLVERYKELYQGMAVLFGFRLRYCYTWEQFDTAAAALAEGLTIRASINEHVSGIMRASGPGGEEQEWSLFAICFEGLIRQFFEPDTISPPTSLDHEKGERSE